MVPLRDHAARHAFLSVTLHSERLSHSRLRRRHLPNMMRRSFSLPAHPPLLVPPHTIVIVPGRRPQSPDPNKPVSSSRTPSWRPPTVVLIRGIIMRNLSYPVLRRPTCPGLRATALLVTVFLPDVALTQTTTSLPPINVEAETGGAYCPMDSGEIGKSEINSRNVLGAADTASLLSGIPGVNISTGGGVSSLPTVHGLADDRNRTLVDGMALTSSCPNHMNPALSYIAPGSVGNISVMAGITPVSAGGDSVGGTISVDPRPPTFAAPGESLVSHGTATTAYRSNNRQIGANGEVTAATEQLSLGYNGGWTRADDVHDGNGNAILASRFENQSHAIAAAAKTENGLLVLRAGHQITPQEGFPNQRMDLLGNTNNFLNIGYNGNYAWGKIEAKAYWQNVKHFMNFLGERKSMMPMPMNTNGTDTGYSLKAEIPLSAQDTLRLGNEYHLYRLHDWWPPVSGAFPSMGNGTFQNINEGSRDVLGTYAEWATTWSQKWSSLIGVRNDTVWMNTGNVAGYSNCNSGGMSMMGAMTSACSMMPGTINYASDSAGFNALNHQRTDNNFDFSATARYDATTVNSDEIGFARKTRSPNLYERYAWSTGTMASSMVNWFGNGADYVGNINLKPETANTASVSTEWHDAERKDWNVKFTPYYTYVEDYIGVDLLKANVTPGVNQLRFANHDAEIAGFDLSGTKSLSKDGAFGDFDVAGIVGLVKGWQVNNGKALYHMQPLNALLSLNHHFENWASSVELKLVNDKSTVNPLQNEQRTPGYAIVNWRTSYQFQNLKLAVGIDNLFNRQYYDPNGGAYVSGWRAMGNNYNNYPMGALPAAGRSLNAGITVSF